MLQGTSPLVPPRGCPALDIFIVSQSSKYREETRETRRARHAKMSNVKREVQNCPAGESAIAGAFAPSFIFCCHKNPEDEYALSLNYRKSLNEIMRIHDKIRKSLDGSGEDDDGSKQAGDL